MTILNRILVVDDNKTINSLLVGYLGKYGFLPDSARTFEDAVTLLKRENYDLVVVDSDLDSGKTAIDLLPFIDNDIKIILLKNKSVQADEKFENRKRINDFIPRAFRGEELAVKTKALLGL